MKVRTEPQKKPGDKAHRRALIVEPDKLMRWSLTTFLSRWFEVDAVATPEQAVQLLSHHHFDVAILSQDEPTATLEALQRDLLNENPDVVAVRVVTSRDDAPNTGQTKAIEKPFDLATLAALINVDSLNT